MLTLQPFYMSSCITTYIFSKGRQFVSKCFIGFAWSFLFGSQARTKYLVGRTNEWVANPLGLRQTNTLQIKINQVFFILNTRELSVKRKDLSLNLSWTSPGEPCTRPPSCTTLQQSTMTGIGCCRLEWQPCNV